MRFPFTFGDAPVPYTAAWSEEQENRAPRVVRWGPASLRRPYVSDGVNRPGAGKPVFKVLHADRCREVIGGDLCQMCVKPLCKTRICMTSGTTLKARPLVVDGLPMHHACAFAAYQACPGLRRSEAEGRLRIFAIPEDGYDLAPKVLGITSGPGSDERVNALLRQHGRLYSGPDLVLRVFRWMSLAELQSVMEFDHFSDVSKMVEPGVKRSKALDELAQHDADLLDIPTPQEARP